MFLNKMLVLFLLSLLICRVDGGELIVAQSPVSVKFELIRGRLDQHLLPEILTSAMGFSDEKEPHWTGMTILDPFCYTEAVVVLYIEGIPTFGDFGNILQYPVNNDLSEIETFDRTKQKIMERFPGANSTFMRVELGWSHGVFDEFDTVFLDKDREPDARFLKELGDLSTLIEIDKKVDGISDLYWFSMKGLKTLAESKDSNATMEAMDLVYETLLKMGEAFDIEYDGQALVVALLSDGQHERIRRSALDNANNSGADAAKNHIYDPDFPVIFNIILWFAVSFIFSVIAITVFIAGMDPGRDSIIYRMTSNRIKKDN